MAQPAGSGPTLNKDLTSAVKGVSAVLPKVLTATETGTDINLKGYSSAAVVVSVGVVGDSPLSGSKKQTWTVEEADDDGAGAAGSYTAVADANFLDPDGVIASGALVIDADGECSTVYEFGLTGVKQWIRLVCTLTGSHSTGTPASAVVIKGNPDRLPATM